MLKAISRTYRPQTFSAVIGQKHIAITIQNQVTGNVVAQAYLFSGPRGVGKTTIARLLAKAVNCQDRKSGSGEPCNSCKHCLDFANNQALDIVEIDAASHTGVDNVRENIIEAARYSPNQGKYKVFIIDEAHMLSTSAFNALLKTLEEPPPHVLFILATTELHKIPATIISRCQRFDFHKLTKAELISRLKIIALSEKVEVDEAVYESIARISDGCLRDAESVFSQVLVLGDKTITSDIASLVLPSSYIEAIKDITEAIIKNDISLAIRIINDFVEQGGQMKPFLEEMVDYVRERMMQELKVKSEKLQVYRELLDELLDVRQTPAPEAFAQLPFELMVARFCQRFQESGVMDRLSATPCAGQAFVEELGNKGRELDVGNIEISPILFTAEDLKAKWKRCCDVVARTHITLPLVLMNAQPIGVYGNKVHIRFTRNFHFETMSQRKNLDVLAGAIVEVMGANVEIIPIFEKAEAEKVVGDLAEAFGGFVVE